MVEKKLVALEAKCIWKMRLLWELPEGIELVCEGPMGKNEEGKNLDEIISYVPDEKRCQSCNGYNKNFMGRDLGCGDYFEIKDVGKSS